MKSIIACTDFSADATNAVHYAAALAKATDTPLVLFHHFTYPVQATDLPSLLPLLIDEVSDSLVTRLEDIRTGLIRAYDIRVKCVVRSWTLFIDLEEIFETEQASLAVVGSHGTDPVLSTLFGSITATLIRRGKTPLLVIPREATFHPLQKILFPHDAQAMASPAVLQALRELALAFDAYIELLHLSDAEQTPADAPAYADRPFEALLGDIRHGYAHDEAFAVSAGILAEAAKSGADLVAMIPHHHGLLSNLLSLSKTQQVAASISLPLLVLGERLPATQE